MSFWKKLFGGGGSASDPISDGNPYVRSPRIRLLLADGARFETADGAYPLLNISESGLGLLAENSAAGRMSGTLFLGSETLPVELEVVRQTGTFVGARFVSDTTPVRSVLRRLFLEEIRATEMSQVSGRELQVESGTPRWYYAPGNYELFYVEREGKPERLEMEWNGRVVAANHGERARIGHLHEESREKPGHPKSSLVDWEGEIGDEDRTKAIRILENVAGLDPAVRGMLVGMLRR